MKHVRAGTGNPVETTPKACLAGRAGGPSQGALRVIAHRKNKSAHERVCSSNSILAFLLAAFVLPLSRSASDARKHFSCVRRRFFRRGTFDRIVGNRSRMPIASGRPFSQAVQTGDFPGLAIVHRDRSDWEFAPTLPTASRVSKLNRLWRPRRFTVHTDDTRAPENQSARGRVQRVGLPRLLHLLRVLKAPRCLRPGTRQQVRLFPFNSCAPR